LLDLLGFTTFVLLIGQLGTVEAEASSMAFSVSMLAFMPVWGMSQAASILVGQHLGENREALAARATWTALAIALVYMLVISVLYVFTPQVFLGTFFLDGAARETDVEVRELALTLMRFVAAYNLFDAIGMVFVGALKGAGDTRFVLFVSMVLATLLIGASWLAVDVMEWRLYGSWSIITLWIWLMGSIYFVRFIGGKWRKMRVIEEPTIPLPE
jgi:MATE family multidrug resistance protein